MKHSITWTIPAVLAQTGGLTPESQDTTPPAGQSNGADAATNSPNPAAQGSDARTGGSTAADGGQANAADANAENGTQQGTTGEDSNNLSASSEDSDDGGGLLGSGAPMLILLLFFVVLWIFLMGGQRKEKKKRAEMLSSLEKGNRVQTVGGVLGTIVEIRDDEIIVKVDENTNARMRFARSAIQSVRDEEESASEEVKT